jgi:GxxExxY protein
MDEPDGRVDATARQIVDAAIEIHKTLGPGFGESTYEAALCLELSLRRIRFVRQPPVAVVYKGEVVGQHRLDLLVDDCVIVELKAVDALNPVHTAQVLSYLKATGKPLGLLLNFNVPLMKHGIRRIVRS